MSNKITFSHEVRHWQTDELIKTYNMTVHEETLGELVEDFEMFIKGCGFVIPEGARLDFVYEQDNIQPEGIEVTKEMIDEWAKAHYGHDIDWRNK